MRKEISTSGERYDSSQDALSHIEIVRANIDKMVSEIKLRGENHDLSKLQEPEKSSNDYFIPLLKKVKFGTPEYVKVDSERRNGEGLKHHFKVNRHHPDHFQNGINDMNIVDIIEMICDTIAASRKSDSSFEDGLKFNAERYNFPKELENIILNTYNEYFK